MGNCGDQDQAIDPPRVLRRQGNGRRTTRGYADDGHARDGQRLEHGGYQIRGSRWSGGIRHRRASIARSRGSDQLEARRIKSFVKQIIAAAAMPPVHKQHRLALAIQAVFDRAERGVANVDVVVHTDGFGA